MYIILFFLVEVSCHLVFVEEREVDRCPIFVLQPLSLPDTRRTSSPQVLTLLVFEISFFPVDETRMGPVSFALVHISAHLDKDGSLSMPLFLTPMRRPGAESR